MGSSDQEDVYIVERIENKKIRNGIVYYLIKWEGYEEKTWEPEDNIIDSQLIDEFNIKFERDRKDLAAQSQKTDTSSPIAPQKQFSSSEPKDPSLKKPSKFVISEDGANEDTDSSVGARTDKFFDAQNQEEFIGGSTTKEKIAADVVPEPVKKLYDLALDSDDSDHESTESDSLEDSADEMEIEMSSNTISLFKGPHSSKCEVCQRAKPKPESCSICTSSVHIDCAKESLPSFSTKNGVHCISCSRREPVCCICNNGKKLDDYFFRCSRCDVCYHEGCQDTSKKSNMDEFYCYCCSKFNANIQQILTSKSAKDQDGNILSNEYYVKFEGKSYRSCCWVPESWLERVSAMKLKNFQKVNFSPLLEELVLPDYLKIDKILAYKSHQIEQTTAGDDQPSYEMRAFIKWKSMPYSECSWDREADLVSYDAEEFNQKLLEYKKSLIIFKGWNPILPSPSAFQEFKETPPFFKRSLLPHQLEGMNWISYKWMTKQSVLLADEMGLGKTIQTIGFLMNIFKNFKSFPFLIVCPTSVCLNWQSEFDAWAPELSTVVYSGNQNDREIIAEYELFNSFIPKSSSKFPRPIKNHIVIVSYNLLSRDKHNFTKIPWEVVVVDEAQRLKGNTNELSTVLESIQTKFKLILTGTPLQNNLRELFNIMRYIAPDNFKHASAMEEYYKNMNEDPSKVTQLHELLRPYMLRRTKSDVKNYYSIPPKAELVLPVTMTAFQASIYKMIFEKNKSLLLSKLGATGKKVSFENLMMELRKCANHPLLCTTRNIKEIETEQEWNVDDIINASGKLVLLVKLLEKLLNKKHRVLLFCGMVKMLDIIQQVLKTKNIHYLRIDGQTSPHERQGLVNLFNSTDTKINVFLLSTRAGGLGINLQSADSIIMYDTDFNPHQDLQAYSRAHRFGQMNKVVIYKMLTLNSVEEKISQIANKKLLLDHIVVERMNDKSFSDEPDNLFDILSCGITKLFSEESNEKEQFSFDEEMLDELTNFDFVINKYETSHINEEEKGLPSTGIFKDGFKFAKIWEVASTTLATDTAATNESPKMQDSVEGESEDYFWSKIFKPEPEADTQPEDLGIGKRKRKQISNDGLGNLPPEVLDSPEKTESKKKRKPEDDIYVPNEADSSTTDNELDDDVQSGTARSVPAKDDLSHQLTLVFVHPIMIIDIKKHNFDIHHLIQESKHIKYSKEILKQSLLVHPIASNNDQICFASKKGFCWFILSNAIFFGVTGYVCIKFNIEHCIWSIPFVNSQDTNALKVIISREGSYRDALVAILNKMQPNTQNPTEPSNYTNPQNSSIKTSPVSYGFNCVELEKDAAVAGDSPNIIVSSSFQPLTPGVSFGNFNVKEVESSSDSEVPPKNAFPEKEQLSRSNSSVPDTNKNGVKIQTTFQKNKESFSTPISMPITGTVITSKQPLKKDPILINSKEPPAVSRVPVDSIMKSTKKPSDTGFSDSTTEKLISTNSQSVAGDIKKDKKVVSPSIDKKLPSISTDILNSFSVEQIVDHLEARLYAIKSTLSTLPKSQSSESVMLENELLRSRNKSLSKVIERTQKKQSISDQIASSAVSTSLLKCEWQECGEKFMSREGLLRHLSTHY